MSSRCHERGDVLASWDWQREQGRHVVGEGETRRERERLGEGEGKMVVFVVVFVVWWRCRWYRCRVSSVRVRAFTLRSHRASSLQTLMRGREDESL